MGIQNTDNNDFFDFVITGQRIQRQTNHVCIHPQMSGIGYDYVVAILQLSLDQDLPSYPKVVHKFVHMFLNGNINYII